MSKKMRIFARIFVYMRIRTCYILLILLLCVMNMQAQIDRPIDYKANDSIILLGNGNAILHGESQVRYDQMEIESEYIRVNLDSSTIYACGVMDTVEGEIVGKPVFKDGKDSYDSDEMTYNIRTQKGYIRRVVTTQGEGHIVADKTKKNSDNTMMMADGRYTTCDDHDHPHFYLNLTKAKVEPGKYIATGPAYLVVGDVPLPLAVPFAFFPFTNSYASGLIMPTFGDDYQRGLYLRGLGYYFALSDYCDLEVTGDIYTRGTWAVRAKSQYRWRYHFNGNVGIDFRQDVVGEKDMPNYSKSTNFSVRWTHSQDSKANPYCNFSASVNFSTSGYNRSNINSYYNTALNSENTKSSSINYTQRFPNSPFTISASASISQRTKDSTLSLTAPELSVTMSSIAPFKRKNAVGKEKWYEKIKMSYSSNARIQIDNVKESQFLKTNFLRDWKTGMRHQAGLNASFTIAKYINVTPSISMTDRMYFTRDDIVWNPEAHKLDTTLQTGFYNVFDFNVGLSMSTKLYGFYIPSRKLFPHSSVDRFRHVMTPTISFSYHPDFGTKTWNYYGEYEQHYIGADGVERVMQQTYSRYRNGIYGNASQGAATSLNFGLQNNLEVKVVNKKDTTGKEPYKVISLIDNFSVDGGYNFIADSMNWSNFRVNLRIKLPKVVNYTINLSTSLDPYMYELNPMGTPVRTNKQYWHNGRFPHWSGVGTSFSYTFNNQTIQKWVEKAGKRKGRSSSPADDDTTQDDLNLDPITKNEDGSDTNAKLNSKRKDEIEDGYVKTQINWSLSVNYTISYSAVGGFDYEKMYPKMGLVNNLSLSGSLGLGQGWKVSASTAFDFRAKRFTTTQFNVSRDLHCWNMTASFVPFGPYKNYTFHIGVNASMLADLKYDKSSTDNTNKHVNWW